MKYTKEQKQEYFKNLRDRWTTSKALADKDDTAKALYNEVGGDFSYYSFYWTLADMKNLGLEGIPYVDVKTFKGWKDAGFTVKKGEKSKLSGITWLPVKDKDGEETEYMVPKEYRLFHKTQVEEIK